MFLPAHANTYMFLPTFLLPDPRLWDLEGSSSSSLGHGHYLRNKAAGWGLELSGLIVKKMLKMLCLSSSVFKSHALK